MTSIAASDSTKIIGSTDAENAIVELSENKLDNENKLEEFEEDFPNDEELDLSNHSNNPTKMKIKVDVYSYPVEINISQYTLVSLVKRLRLADVVTTSSPHLPPYLIINELGVSVKCNIGIGSQIITSEKISIGASFPIEIHHLSKSSNSIKKDRLNAVDNSDDKEHLLHLSFAMNDEIYESVKPLPIDREGISSFDIRLKQFNKIQSINSSTSLSSLPKSTEDTPFVLLSMRIKEDGGREIIIRSMLSFKNQTSRLLYLSLRRNSVNIEVSILPGNEWYVPIYLAHPRTSLHLRFDKNSEWFEALPVLISLMLQGQWGLPSKLRSELVSCPPEVDTIDGKRTSWILLLRPDVKESRGGTYISVKYPSKDPHRPPPMPISGVGALESSEIAGVDGLVGLDDIYQKSVATASATSVAASYLLSQATNSLFRNINSIQPMCINFLAPLQLCNIIPQPLLYRIADADGLITSEGILLPGEIKDLILPTVDLQLSMKEHFIRISIPYVIFNRTGYHLEYCESKNTDSYIPQISETSADRQVDVSTESTYLKLYPGAITSFHHPFKDKVKLLEIRRLLNKSLFTKTLSQTADNDKVNLWSGEIDICNLGIVYCKLRSPIKIVKIDIEMIGASFVATFSEHSLKWPPYRIDNQTNYDVRVKQLLNNEKNSSISAFERLASFINNNNTVSLQNQLEKANEFIDWEYIPGNSSISYTWDYPKSGPNKAVDNLLNDSNTLIDSEDEIEEDVDEEDSIVLSTVTDSIQTVESLNKEESSKPVQNLSRPSIFDNTSSIENMRTVSPNTTRRKSMILNSMPKKKEIDIQQQIQILKEKYVKFKPPSINPELLAHSLSFDNSSNNSDKIKNETDSYDVLGFTVLLNDIKYHFKCSTMLEYFGWIQACRLGIELSWIEYMKFYPNTSNDTNININQYKTKIYLKVRSDGPSKVLEIYEPHSDKKKTNEIINQVNQSNISNSQDNYRITDALSVSIIAQSIGISLIDNEPSEVLHLSLQEIEISIERTRNLVRMGGTIQTILVSNQLLNPFYPVALFPRRNETDTDESKNVQRLLLPGLHQHDIVLHIHPSPEFALTTTEMALVSLLTQIDSSRICLNALITEHAYGSYTIILEIITKHYRAALWKQLHKLIGSTDLVDGSIGLVANLGTGVYDMFYEPIDGLIDDNNSNPNLTAPNSNNVSFFNGISKGGKVLATKAIGGTSAITSKITGGLGRGVALLTLDSSFQRNRYARRMNKSNSVSEGIVIGTKELGKNIVEGVTGIVISPYRGWEEGGGVGLGMGIAKGILGVAFKPAVGVFDLASRTTEGLRNIAYNAQTNDLFGHRKFRRRIPRSF
eukprot:gene17712-23304_t